ncbi:MAG: anaerobic glycerol-3-phosphate dehydrogenase subunit GlpC [Thermodesulfobacteriota bacterium]
MIDLDNVSFDHCIKCTVCTAYCPVARADQRYPGPKASGPDTERLRIRNPELLDKTLSFCTNCKRCEVVCPSDVAIADVIFAARSKYAGRKLSPRDFALSHTDLLGRVSTRMAPLVNTVTRNRAARRLMDRMLSIAEDGPFPSYERGDFHSWFARYMAPGQERFPEKAVYFTGCYVNYLDHGLGRATAASLNAVGLGMMLTREKCCGVPLIANGFLKKAEKNARHNIRTLEKALARFPGAPIVLSSSSCTYALAGEYEGLLNLDNSGISGSIRYMTRLLSEKMEQGAAPALGELPLRVAYHAPCHLLRMGGAPYTLDVLHRIPGLSVTQLASECCGLSGTYGFKKEYEKVSGKVGENLFAQIKSLAPHLVVTDCETCKWQIEAKTGVRTVHPVTLFSLALALGK